MFWVLAIGILAYLAAALLPQPEHASPLLWLLLKSSTTTLIFGGLVWHFKLSPDINQLIEKAWKKVK